MNRTNQARNTRWWSHKREIRLARFRRRRQSKVGCELRDVSGNSLIKVRAAFITGGCDNKDEAGSLGVGLEPISAFRICKNTSQSIGNADLGHSVFAIALRSLCIMVVIDNARYCDWIIRHCRWFLCRVWHGINLQLEKWRR